ncbi:MAG: hypothetical protein ABSH06_23755 [Thermodesulfobacteriota bacterium]
MDLLRQTACSDGATISELGLAWTVRPQLGIGLRNDRTVRSF